MYIYMGVHVLQINTYLRMYIHRYMCGCPWLISLICIFKQLLPFIVHCRDGRSFTNSLCQIYELLLISLIAFSQYLVCKCVYSTYSAALKFCTSAVFVVTILNAFCASLGKVSWQFMHGLMENAIYGGRVDNIYDMRVLQSYLVQLFDNKLLTGEVVISIA